MLVEETARYQLGQLGEVTCAWKHCLGTRHKELEWGTRRGVGGVLDMEALNKGGGILDASSERSAFTRGMLDIAGVLQIPVVVKVAGVAATLWGCST